MQTITLQHWTRFVMVALCGIAGGTLVGCTSSGDVNPGAALGVLIGGAQIAAGIDSDNSNLLIGGVQTSLQSAALADDEPYTAVQPGITALNYAGSSGNGGGGQQATNDAELCRQVAQAKQECYQNWQDIGGGTDGQAGAFHDCYLQYQQMFDGMCR